MKVEKPASLLKPLEVSELLLLGPGPSNCPPNVLSAGSLPVLDFLQPEFFEIMHEVKEGLKYLFQTKNAVTLAVSGTGHCGMETAVFNLLEPGDVALIAVNGIWGQRFAALCHRNAVLVKTVEKEIGSAFSITEIEDALRAFRPKLFFMCHSESSTGVMNPLQHIGPLCHKYGCLFLVDTVASLGAVPIMTDDLEIDVIYSGSQKVLGAPPGMFMVSFSDYAMSIVKSRKTKVQSFYLDIVQLANHWGCDGEPHRYHHTEGVTGIYQLREAISFIVKEGLENSINRHMECARMLYRGLEKLGLKCYIKNEEIRLPTVTPIELPFGVDWKGVMNYCIKHYNLRISGGLGPTSGKVWRVGLMGYNCTPKNVTLLLTAISEAMKNCKLTNLSKL